MIDNNQIVQYYDRCEIDYRMIWHLGSRMSMHYGYWDENTRLLRQALCNINAFLAARVDVRSGETVLDAGCGVGGSAIYLAATRAARVTGITLSAQQVRRCRGTAIRNNVTEHTKFDRRDFTATGLPGGSFDVVWAIESVCHTQCKADFLREAYRLLRPGGRLCVADFYRRNLDPQSAEFRLVRKWARCWAVPDFAVITDFEADAHAAGFRRLERFDITANIRPSAKRLYYAFFPLLLVALLGELVRVRERIQTENVWSACYQYRALKQGLWRYYVITAEK